MKMEQAQVSETSVHKIQTPEKHPKKEYNLYTLFIIPSPKRNDVSARSVSVRE
jgi:hypothetical protein